MEVCKKKKAAGKFCQVMSVGTVPRSVSFVELKAEHLLLDADVIIKFEDFGFSNSSPLATAGYLLWQPPLYAALELFQGQIRWICSGMWNLRAIL